MKEKTMDDDDDDDDNNNNYTAAVTTTTTTTNSSSNNSVTLVCERTIPTELLPLVGEVGANFCGYRMSRDQRDGPVRPYSRFCRSQQLRFLPSSSSG
jgi:hypothetical protein